MKVSNLGLVLSGAIVLMFIVLVFSFNSPSNIRLSDSGTTPALESTESLCTDGVDNDGDLAIDCADSSCEMVLTKREGKLVCAPDSRCVDNDGDGFYNISSSDEDYECGPLDCDDSENKRSPSYLNVEDSVSLCNDGIDNDCTLTADFCGGSLTDDSCQELYKKNFKQLCCGGVVTQINTSNCGSCNHVCCSMDICVSPNVVPGITDYTCRGMFGTNANGNSAFDPLINEPLVSKRIEYTNFANCDGRTIGTGTCGVGGDGYYRCERRY
ncbi:MAG: hypothetical protein AABX11_03800 [Nanoarchaeota archaeon]